MIFFEGSLCRFELTVSGGISETGVDVEVEVAVEDDVAGETELV